MRVTQLPVPGGVSDPVFVSRLRRDISHPKGIDMWVVADNIRKGAALNALQIMDLLEKNGTTTRIRKSRGKDIDAACGQLANKS